MKLAEALSLRADIQKRIAQLSERLNLNAKVQEGESPSENPKDLLEELDKCSDQLEKMIFKINHTNCNTYYEKRTITELIALRDTKMLKNSIVRTFLKNASETITRYSAKEIKCVSTVNVAKLQANVDEEAKQIRELDVKIQELNWTTELLEN